MSPQQLIPFFGGKETIMTNRAGTLVSNLSGEMAYESFRPTLLPPNPPIEVSGELFTKLMLPIKKRAIACGAVVLFFACFLFGLVVK